MSIATVVLRGYGSGGSIGLIVTRGYAIAALVPAEPGGVDPTITGADVAPTITGAGAALTITGGDK